MSRRINRATTVRATAAADRGSAVVDFVLVVPLLLVVALAVMQVALIGHARSVLTAAAAEGARAAALAGANGAAGEARIGDLLGQNAVDGIVQDVRVVPEVVEGTPVMSARIRARIPVVGWIGSGPELVVEGHAVREGAW